MTQRGLGGRGLFLVLRPVLRPARIPFTPRGWQRFGSLNFKPCVL